MSILGKNIRYLRKKNNMSQDALADLVGKKSYTTIQKWETDKAEPTFKITVQLSQIFDISLNRLVSVDLETEKSEDLFTRSRKIPVLGSAAPGIPVKAFQDIYWMGRNSGTACPE